MRILCFSRRREEQAYALLLTLVFTGIVLITFGSMMHWSATNAKITKRNLLFTQSQSAAESAGEVALAAMMRDFTSQGYLNAASTYESLSMLQSNWPVEFEISDGSSNVNQVSVSVGSTNWVALPFQYAGLHGLGQECVVSACATPLNQGENLSAPVTQRVWFGSIPIFQFAIFYNIDLEINPGNTMNINGKVHSNANIWDTGNGSSTPLTFSDVVEAVGKVTQTRGPNDPNTRSGNVVFLLTANNPLSGVNSLNLPIGGTNRSPAAIRAFLDLPPAAVRAPNVAAYSSAGQLYPFNQADLIISNTPAGTNVVVVYQNDNQWPPLTQLLPDTTNIVGGVTNKYFSFATNVTFYDFREFCNVKALQIDVGKLRAWLTNTTATGGKQYDDLNSTGVSSKGHRINSIYVYNNVPFITGSPSTAGRLPAVRLVNGQRLPSAGLGIASSQPFYVEGNYNVTRDGVKYGLTLGSTTNGTTYPAAIMGDAITVLSTNWNDALYIKGQAYGNRKSSDTTINAACFEGIVPSSKDAGGNKHYSGGVENFLRLLEDWSQNNSGHSGSGVLTYNGSIVVMFPSQYAMQNWQDTGNYYNAPNRQWGFDVNFYSQTNIPPMTPQLKAVLREAWVAR